MKVEQLSTWLGPLALLLGLALPALGQGGMPEGTLPQEGAKADAEERRARRKALLERFKKLSPEEREQLRKRYRERLKQASPEERKRLEKRHDRYKKRRAEHKKRHADRKLRHRERGQDFDQRKQGQHDERRQQYRDLLKRLLRQLTPEQRARMLEIADRCPVHRTLHSEVVVRTEAGSDVS